MLPGLLVTETDALPGYGNISKRFFANTASPEIYETVISFTFSRWLFAQHAHSPGTYQTRHFFFLNNVPKVEIYSTEQVDLASCKQMSGDPFLGDSPPASRIYLEMHLKNLLILTVQLSLFSQGHISSQRVQSQ